VLCVRVSGEGARVSCPVRGCVTAEASWNKL